VTFVQQYLAFIGGFVVVAALVLYGVHRLTLGRFTAARTSPADLGHVVVDLGHQSRHGVRPIASVVPRGGTGRPPAGTSAGPRHARAA
jgi:hypothetical protein